MIVGSIKENTTLEKRVSITPESAKNIIGLGLGVCIEKGYALHLGIDDGEYKDAPKVKQEELFGDKYNENMLKGLETRKYEYAAKGKTDA